MCAAPDLDETFPQLPLKMVENNFLILTLGRQLHLRKLLHNTELKLELCSNLKINFCYVFIPVLSNFSSYIWV